MNLFSLLPEKIMNKIKERENLQKIVVNILWLFFDRFFRIIVGFLVSIWVINYLGPDRYGQLNYVIAIMSLFTAFASLGIGNIAVRDMVREPSKKNEIMGTAFIMHLCGAIFAVICTMLTLYLKNQDEMLLFWMGCFISGSLLFQAFNVIDYYFQSEVLSKYTIYAKNSSFLISNILKVIFILFQAELIFFAVAFFLDIILGSVFMLIVYLKNKININRWIFRIERAKYIIKHSWPLMLSGIMILIYMRIDQVMLKNMVDNTTIGIYAAAVKFLEIAYFFPTAIIQSVLPAIIKAKKTDQNLYHARFKMLYSSVTWFGIIMSVFVFLTAEIVLNFLFGPEYAGCGRILAVSIWSVIFVSQGNARAEWLVIEHIQKYNIFFTFLGLITNIVLNVILIPIYSGIGAAIATLISQFVVTIIAPLIFKKTRLSSVLLIKSFIPDIQFIKDNFHRKTD